MTITNGSRTLLNTMQFQIRTKKGNVFLIAQIPANQSCAKSLGAAVKYAVSRNLSLRGADLYCADLRGADLRGAEFTFDESGCIV